MPAFSAESFAATMALIGVVILVAALLSGLVERIGVPQVALFLVLGILLGPQGLGLVELTLESPALESGQGARSVAPGPTAVHSASA